MLCNSQNNIDSFQTAHSSFKNVRNLKVYFYCSSVERADMAGSADAGADGGGAGSAARARAPSGEGSQRARRGRGPSPGGTPRQSLEADPGAGGGRALRVQRSCRHSRRGWQKAGRFQDRR